MILSEFDNNPIAVFNAFDFKQKIEGFPETVVAFFSHDIIDEFVKIYNPETIVTIESLVKDFPIYKITSGGVDIAVMQAPLGAPYIVEIFEEVICHGAKKIVIAGSCGCLEDDIKDYSIIIPTSAIRDEGTSYHYAPESDVIELDSDVTECIENTIKSLKIEYRKGRTWTTDGLFRETRKKVEKRKNQGAIVVDMECSAMTAFAKFRNIKFGEIFYGADSLANEKYDIRSLADRDIPKLAKIIPVAIKCAENISKQIK